MWAIPQAPPPLSTSPSFGRIKDSCPKHSLWFDMKMHDDRSINMADRLKLHNEKLRPDFMAFILPIHPLLGGAISKIVILSKFAA
jgi:hypothetical protein